MQKWEYQILKRHQSQGGQTFQVLSASGELKDFQQAYPEGGHTIPHKLTTLGSEGWELVSVIVDPDTDGDLIHYFKRPFEREQRAMPW